MPKNIWVLEDNHKATDLFQCIEAQYRKKINFTQNQNFMHSVAKACNGADKFKLGIKFSVENRVGDCYTRVLLFLQSLFPQMEETIVGDCMNYFLEDEKYNKKLTNYKALDDTGLKFVAAYDEFKSCLETLVLDKVHKCFANLKIFVVSGHLYDLSQAPTFNKLETHAALLFEYKSEQFLLDLNVGKVDIKTKARVWESILTLYQTNNDKVEWTRDANNLLDIDNLCEQLAKNVFDLYETENCEEDKYFLEVKDKLANILSK